MRKKRTDKAQRIKARDQNYFQTLYQLQYVVRIPVHLLFLLPEKELLHYDQDESSQPECEGKPIPCQRRLHQSVRFAGLKLEKTHK